MHVLTESLEFGKDCFFPHTLIPRQNLGVNIILALFLKSTLINVKHIHKRLASDFIDFC